MIDCFPKFQTKPVSSHLCWNRAVCRWPCWVATRWQRIVQTGWLSGLDPWWGLVHRLYGTRPLLKQIKLFIWRRKWQPTLVFLPGESHGQRSLVSYSLWGPNELDTTERLILTVNSWLTASSLTSLIDTWSESSLWAFYVWLSRPTLCVLQCQDIFASVGWTYSPAHCRTSHSPCNCVIFFQLCSGSCSRICWNKQLLFIGQN